MGAFDGSEPNARTRNTFFTVLACRGKPGTGNVGQSSRPVAFA